MLDHSGAASGNLPIPDDFYAESPRRDSLWTACPPEAQAYMQWQAKALAELNALAAVAWEARGSRASAYKARVLQLAQPLALVRLRDEWDSKRQAKCAAASECSIYNLDANLLERIVCMAVDNSADYIHRDVDDRRDHLENVRDQSELRRLRRFAACRLMDAVAWGAPRAAFITVNKSDGVVHMCRYLERVAVSTSLTKLLILSAQRDMLGVEYGPHGLPRGHHLEDTFETWDYIHEVSAREQRGLTSKIVQRAAPQLTHLTFCAEEVFSDPLTASVLDLLPLMTRLRCLELDGRHIFVAESGLLELLRASRSLDRLLLRDVVARKADELLDALLACSSLRSLCIDGVSRFALPAEGSRDPPFDPDEDAEGRELPWTRLLAFPSLRELQVSHVTTCRGPKARPAGPRELPRALQKLSLSRILTRTRDAALVTAELSELRSSLTALELKFERGSKDQAMLSAPLCALTGLRELVLGSQERIQLGQMDSGAIMKHVRAFAPSLRLDLAAVCPSLRQLRALMLSCVRLDQAWLETSLAPALRASQALATLSIQCCVPRRRMAAPGGPQGATVAAPGTQQQGTAPGDAADELACFARVFHALSDCRALESVQVVSTSLSAGDAAALASVVGRVGRLRELVLDSTGLKAESLDLVRTHVPEACQFKLSRADWWHGPVTSMRFDVES